MPDDALRQALAACLVLLFLPAPGAAFADDGEDSVPDAASDAVDLARHGIYRKTAPRAGPAEPVATRLPLELEPGARIAYIGNTLLERARHFGHFEALLHQRHPRHRLVVRNLAWPADTPDLQPRPLNFADTEQHLTHERADVILAAYGFNESFAGEEGLAEFRRALSDHVARLRAMAFNGKMGPRIVLLSPIANEDVEGVPAGTLNNERIEAYVAAIRDVAAEQRVGFADLFTETRTAMAVRETDLTFNGVHLTEEGYRLLAALLYREVFRETPPRIDETLRRVVVEKNRQYERRFRPVNSYYYTGARNKQYGYLDFLPAMRNFDILVANREERIWSLARGDRVPGAIRGAIDDSNAPPLPATIESRGANTWLTAEKELEAFRIDPRFEVNLFAGEEQFPDIAAPIQMRWDARGRLWVSCSTTYPHVYPNQEPRDKLVILEDTDGDGRADRSSVFADDLHIPLSFEFGDGGVWVSEMPHLTFLKDTDGDGRADSRRIVLTGFGTEDSHHALHDFTWTPDGDLIFREGIFHHSQVETPYGPVRQQNSGWFRFRPRDHRLTSFGSYSSTNPWGVTFDDWGQHVASHPIFASAFHALDPPYPQQHPRPKGLRAYSGTCGQEFVDFSTFPEELRGHLIKVRYKPTNRVEIHEWNEYEFGYDERYVGDLIFSTNLSFIPVDIGFGPRGALYVCDWYNPVKGHAQYSLRDRRRDRHSGRIWRITARARALQDPPRVAGATVAELIDTLRRPEYRVRLWAKRELRERDPVAVREALDRWVRELGRDDPRLRHHQIEAIWTYNWIGDVNVGLLREVLACENRHARAAATRQLRSWHPHLADAIELLRRSANDPSGLVRMEAAIAASYIGTREALDAMLDVARHPRGGHLDYAFRTALGSHTLRRHWEGNPAYPQVPRLLKASARADELAEPTPSARQAEFDSQPDLRRVDISCVPERMKYTVERFTVRTGQPVKLVFTNPDATDHNLVVVRPGALEEVGIAANEMARDPANAASDFIPKEKAPLILHWTPMVGPTRAARVHVLRFTAPEEPGIYPYVCTFPGHWIVMNGEMVVARDVDDIDELLASRPEPAFVRNWTMEDLAADAANLEGRSVTRGAQAFVAARCNQCHAVAGHGVNLGPDLTRVAEKYRGAALLAQIIEPSSEINEDYRTHQILKKNGEVVLGVIREDEGPKVRVIPNLLDPSTVIEVPRKQIRRRIPSQLSPMPEGLVSVLDREQILDMLAFLEAGGDDVPPEFRHDDAAGSGDAHAGHGEGHGQRRGLAGRRPNIVLVMTDDQGKGDLSALGNPDLRTPHLDRLRSQSTRFTDFHVSPTCAPTRSALLGGRHEFRNGVTHTILERERMALSTVTIAEVLAQSGYATGIFGKWHLGDEEPYQPHNRGFDEVFIHGAGGVGQAYPGSCADAPPNRENRYFDIVVRHNRRFVKTEGFCTDVFFRQALGWIAEQRKRDGPFFAYISTNAPHGPMIAPESYKKPFLDAGFDGKTAGRYGMIVNIDDNVGVLMKKLEEWKLDESTLLIFMTDNGQAGGRFTRRNGKRYALHTAGLRSGKGSPYEGGTRVPAFWRWTGTLRAGRDIDALAAHIDVFPTFVALAGAKPPERTQPLDGRSLLPLLESDDSRWADRFLFIHKGRWKKGENPDDFKHADCAVRSERFRLVNNRELYDIEEDPGETTNVIDEHPVVVEKMRAAYDRWWSETRPLMVNEDVPLAPERPYFALYEKQREESGIPKWMPPPVD